jgi:hypothetical protein
VRLTADIVYKGARSVTRTSAGIARRDCSTKPCSGRQRGLRRRLPTSMSNRELHRERVGRVTTSTLLLWKHAAAGANGKHSAWDQLDTGMHRGRVVEPVWCRT